METKMESKTEAEGANKDNFSGQSSKKPLGPSRERFWTNFRIILGRFWGDFGTCFGATASKSKQPPAKATKRKQKQATADNSKQTHAKAGKRRQTEATCSEGVTRAP